MIEWNSTNAKSASTSLSHKKSIIVCFITSLQRKYPELTMAILNPDPREPSMYPSGNLQSSRIILAVDEALMPNLSSFFPRESPGCGMGTRKALIPYRIETAFPIITGVHHLSTENVEMCCVMPCVSVSCLWWQRQWQQRHPSCWWSKLWFRSAPTHLPPDVLWWRLHPHHCHCLNFNSITLVWWKKEKYVLICVQTTLKNISHPHILAAVVVNWCCTNKIELNELSIYRHILIYHDFWLTLYSGSDIGN